ncbi:hypothetical protein [Mucilaginibacter sp. SJ]|uniref:hypothetical protein n=1 Tax=Mucilaginibacter sp. SJ TaxID=3029053 RepID=UPI0023A9C1CA|nr:hypothetical protein [Mucilaginibacter sp. SJ]WEA01847.1 hypothetical protein MusilaSJ_02775 [Mucilaginibacter sp. SJ]
MITEQIFDKFLTWLQPLKSEHGKGVSHKSSVERCLVNHWARTRLFETGSFGGSSKDHHRQPSEYKRIIMTKANTKMLVVVEELTACGLFIWSMAQETRINLKS